MKKCRGHSCCKKGKTATLLPESTSSSSTVPSTSVSSHLMSCSTSMSLEHNQSRPTEQSLFRTTWMTLTEKIPFCPCMSWSNLPCIAPIGRQRRDWAFLTYLLQKFRPYKPAVDAAAQVDIIDVWCKKRRVYFKCTAVGICLKDKNGHNPDTSWYLTGA